MAFFIALPVACAPADIRIVPTETALPTKTNVPALTDTANPPTSTTLPTLLPIILLPTLTPTNSSCQLNIRGTYNYSKTDKIFKLGPGKVLFYDKPGGGHYGNDQASCELNYDCTQLRALNKDSAEPNPEGVAGAWVDVQTGTSTAKWQDYIVKCSLAPAQ